MPGDTVILLLCNEQRVAWASPAILGERGLNFQQGMARSVVPGGPKL